MVKIVAVGGGEMGRPGYSIETLAIDKEICMLTGKKHPRLLFIPTASHDSQGYIEVVKNYFGKRLGCTIDTLCLVSARPSYSTMRRQVLSSDIVYVGGGDTGFMLRLWRKTKLDKVLEEAYAQDIVLAGVSAGALCWFRYGCSDTKRFKRQNDTRLTRVRGLGFIPALGSPHHIREPHRKKGIIELMKHTPGIGIALDDCCALEIVDDTYRLLSTKREAKAHKVYHSRGALHYLPLQPSMKSKQLVSLFSRS